MKGQTISAVLFRIMKAVCPHGRESKQYRSKQRAQEERVHPLPGRQRSLLSSCYVPGTVWGPEPQSTEHRRKISLLSSLCSGMGKEVDAEYK